MRKIKINIIIKKAMRETCYINRHIFQELWAVTIPFTQGGRTEFDKSKKKILLDILRKTNKIIQVGIIISFIQLPFVFWCYYSIFLTPSHSTYPTNPLKIPIYHTFIPHWENYYLQIVPLPQFIPIFISSLSFSSCAQRKIVLHPFQN